MNDVVTLPPAPEARSVDVGRGLGWWTDAWPLFTRAAGMWIAMALATIIAAIVVSFVPVIGGLAVSLVAPVVMGSFMLAARKVEQGGTLAFDDLFTGFRERFGPLAIVGALVLAASLVIGLLVGVMGMGAIFGAAAGGAAGSGTGVFAALGAGMLVLLLAFAAGLVVGMAVWFAPALIVFDNLQPVEAMKASFGACLKNILPLLVYGLIYIAAAFIASIPLGLGWIVLAPMIVLTVYVTYKDVFGRSA